jgi:hypothetical protein
MTEGWPLALGWLELGLMLVALAWVLLRGPR